MMAYGCGERMSMGCDMGFALMTGVEFEVAATAHDQGVEVMIGPSLSDETDSVANGWYGETVLMVVLHEDPVERSNLCDYLALVLKTDAEGIVND
jgi:hypothetical protein